MSIRRKTIIEATTSLSYSSAFNILGCGTITAGPFADEDEGVQIQYRNNGSDWYSLYLNGVLQEITPKHSILTINGPGKFRCLKTATASPCSVNLWESEGFI